MQSGHYCIPAISRMRRDYYIDEFFHGGHMDAPDLIPRGSASVFVIEIDSSINASFFDSRY
jgi:hypothetical protein